MDPKSISLVMIVRNEAQSLERCLHSTAGIVNEMVIVDTGSDDGTPELAQRLGAMVHHFEQDPGEMLNLAKARNYGIEKAKGDWILHLDADEELAPGASEALKNLEPDESTHGYLVTMADTATTDERGIVRLFRNDPEIRFAGAFHEQVRFGQYELASDKPFIQWSRLRIIHHGYEKGSRQDKLERNISSLEEILKSSPDDHRTMLHLANEYANASRFGEALPLYAQVIDHGPNEDKPLAFRNLALCRAASGDTKGAIETLASGASRYPEYAELIFLQGLFELKDGRPEQAFGLFRERMRTPERSEHLPHTPGAGTNLSAILIALSLDQAGDQAGSEKLFASLSRQLQNDMAELATYQNFLATHFGTELAESVLGKIQRATPSAPSNNKGGPR